MAQFVVAAAGAALGSFFGPVGMQIGWAIGAAVGSSLGPGQHTYGARLSDLRAPKLQYGAKVPRIYGRVRTAGALSWQSDLEKVETTTSAGGKGGPSVTQTTYTYYCSLYITLADGVNCTGITRVWRDGKLVYSTLADSSGPTIDASLTSEQWDDIRFYDGNAAQLPDPVYETAVGTANAIARRGRASVFIERLNCGNSGQVGLLEFEVVTNSTGTAAQSGAFRAASHGLGTTPTLPAGVAAGDALILLVLSDPGGITSAPAGYTLVATQSDAGGFAVLTVYKREADGTAADSATTFTVYGGGSAYWTMVAVRSPSTGFPQFPDGTHGFVFGADASGEEPDYLSSRQATLTGETATVALTCAFLAYKPVEGGVQFATVPVGYTDIATGSFTSIWPDYVFAMRTAWRNAGGTENPYGFHLVTDAGGPLNPLSLAGESAATILVGLGAASCVLPGTVDLADIVAAEHSRANGGVASEYDVSALVGHAVTGSAAGGSAREAIEALRAAFYFDAVVVGSKVYYAMRGGASAATVPWADTGNGLDQPSEPFCGPGRDNELELAAKVAVTYTNLATDYDDDTQEGDRLVGQSNKIDSVRIPIVAAPAQMKGVAETIAADGRVAAHTAKVTIGDEWAKLQPTNVATWTDADGNAYRMRIEETTYSDAGYEHQLVLDEADVLLTVGITADTGVPAITVVAPAATELLLLDAPIFRDADNDPGFYAFMKPATGESWTLGAALFESLDGATWTRVGSVTHAATFGTTTSALGDWTDGEVFDETNSVTVDVGDGTLASSTRSAMLLDRSINVAAIGTAGAWEIIRFRTATLVTTGVYKLTGLLRGLRGTERYTGTHASGDSFVLIQVPGSLRVPRTAAQLGISYSYKGASVGRAISTATAQSLTDQGIGLKPESPVLLRAARDAGTGDITLSWTRRTRLQTRFGGTLGDSAPLGEDSEAYTVTIYTDNTYATEKRTIAATTGSATYTSSQQVADFGSNQATVYVGVTQSSAIVGAGYAERQAA